MYKVIESLASPRRHFSFQETYTVSHWKPNFFCTMIPSPGASRNASKRTSSTLLSRIASLAFLWRLESGESYLLLSEFSCTELAPTDFLLRSRFTNFPFRKILRMLPGECLLKSGRKVGRHALITAKAPSNWVQYIVGAWLSAEYRLKSSPSQWKIDLHVTS